MRDEYIRSVKGRLDRLSDIQREAMTTYLMDDYGNGMDDLYADLGDTLGCDVYNGVSKVVLYLPEFDDVVFKIPFLRQATIWNDLGEYSDMLANNDFMGESKPFKCADHDGLYVCPDNDYCSAEAFLSLKIPDDIQDMFCKTEFLFTYNKNDIYVPVYVSRRARYDFWEFEPEVSDRSKTSAKDMDHDWVFEDDGTESEVTSIFIEDYGIERTRELYDFVGKWKIYDLHNGNLMYDDNQDIVIIDFSGYCG